MICPPLYHRRGIMDARSPLYPALESVDTIEDSLHTIRTLSVIPALLPEASQDLVLVILSVVNHYADEAMISAKNISALLHSL
jgi:hypothetical protein